MITMLDIGYNGRLGNQMFQMAALFSKARKYGYDLRLPFENTVEQPLGPYNPGTQSRMMVRIDLFDAFNINQNCLLPRRLISSEIKKNYKENSFYYEEKFEEATDNTNFSGYFQSYKYFSDVSHDVRRLFSFKSLWTSKSITAIEKERSKNLSLVSVHIRRTDYLQPSKNHYSLSIEYYRKAMSFFGKECLFLIFSDDMKWCRENFNQSNTCYVETGSSYADLQAMSMCDHHIIANSTYSWWGAWLNKSQSKKVIAPDRWFAEGSEINAVDIYPEDWMKANEL